MEALKKDNAALKEMLRKKFDQELEYNTKCYRLECEVETLKKAQNNIKEEHENKIETLENENDELKKTLKKQSDQELAIRSKCDGLQCEIETLEYENVEMKKVLKTKAVVLKKYEDENETLEKEIVELKKKLKEQSDQNLENQSKCDRLECEMETLKKAQNDIKEEYENKIETLENKKDELKKTLKKNLLENLKTLTKFENKIKTSEKEIVELKKILKEQSDQKLETQSKCDRLQCEVETLKKEQNEIKNNLKGAYEDEIETLKKQIVELKKRMLKEQSDQKLVLSLSNDFTFANEEMIKNEVKEEGIDQDGIAPISTSNSASPSGGSTKPVSENDTSPKGNRKAIIVKLVHAKYWLVLETFISK